MKISFWGLLPRARVPLWFNRLDRNVVLLGPLSFIGTDSGVISYRDVCNNEGVAPGYGGDGLRPKARGPMCVLGLHLRIQVSAGNWRVGWCPEVLDCDGAEWLGLEMKLGTNDLWLSLVCSGRARRPVPRPRPTARSAALRHSRAWLGNDSGPVRS